MKKVFNKTFAAIMLAIVMVLALFSGLFFVGHGEVASAEGEEVNVKIEADTKTFSKGTKFNVTITINTTISNAIFSSLTLNFGPVNSAKNGFDEDKCKMLTFVPYKDNALFGRSDNFKNKYFSANSSAVVDESNNESELTYAKDGLVSISIAFDGQTRLACTEKVTLTFGISIGSDVPDGTQFELGVLEENAVNFYEYCPVDGDIATDTMGKGVKVATTNSAFNLTPLTFTVKEPSSVNSLSGIRVGQGETSADLTSLDTTSTNLSATVKDMNSPIAIYPELPTNAGNATIKVKATNDASDAGTAVNAKEVSKFTIPADGKLSIIVTAENGDTKEYVLTVKIVDAVLTALTAKSDTKVTGTNEGVQGTFDSKTLKYTVFVPSDATKVSITATVSTGNSAKNTVQLSTTGSCTAPASGVSGTAFDVTGVANNDKLTIKAEAYDGSINSYKNYEIEFKIKDVDTAIDLTVVGNTTKKTFTNNATKATDKKVDYYYIVAGETNAASEVTITFPTTASKVTLDSQVYTASKILTAGEHTVVVTAEAGNTKEYKFILKAYTALQLKSGVVADFMLEEISGSSVYRRTYKEKSLVHGKDDLDFDRFVIGQIGPKTTVNTFITNFETAVANSIKLYKADGTLVYNLGSPADGVTADDFNNTDMGIGTGWKLEYIVDNDVEETVYLSVLGDIDGNGYVNAFDISFLSSVIRGISTDVQKITGSLELRLAAYVSNNVSYSNNKPDIKANEIALISRYIKGNLTLSDLYYNAT